MEKIDILFTHSRRQDLWVIKEHREHVIDTHKELPLLHSNSDRFPHYGVDFRRNLQLHSVISRVCGDSRFLNPFNIINSSDVGGQELKRARS